MFYLIFFFFFLVGFVSLIVGFARQQPVFYLIGTGLIAVLGGAMFGSGIDFPIDTQITYNAGGDVNATLAVLRNFSADTTSVSYDFGVWALGLLFLIGGLIGTVASLWFTIDWTFKNQKKHKQEKLEEELLNKRVEGLARAEERRAQGGIR